MRQGQKIRHIVLTYLKNKYRHVFWSKWQIYIGTHTIRTSTGKWTAKLEVYSLCTNMNTDSLEFETRTIIWWPKADMKPWCLIVGVSCISLGVLELNLLHRSIKTPFLSTSHRPHHITNKNTLCISSFSSHAVKYLGFISP